MRTVFITVSYPHLDVNKRQLVAVDADENEKPEKWQFETSRGAASGQAGFLVFTDGWFSDYILRLVVNKKYIPEHTKKQLAQKPVMLPHWSPML